MLQLSLKNTLKGLLPFLILLLLAIFGYWQVAIFQYPLKWDLIDTAFPWKYFIGECLQENMLPLWNPYQHCGYPIHADPQSSAWYPITWFFGYIWGYSVYIMSIDFIFHIFLAGSGMYLLGRKLGFQEKVALIMGIAYMFSGFFVGNAQHFMWLISATWLPFILIAYIDLYQKRKLKQAVIFGLLMFLMVTGGYPAFTMILFYLLLFIFILFSTKIFRNEGKSSFYRFFKINMLALAFSVINSVVMLFSIWKLMPTLTRTGGVTLQEALFGPLSPQSLISFILPLGAVTHDISFFGTDLSMTNTYFGLFLLIFFIASLFMKKPPLIKLFLFWGFFMLFAAVGSTLPVREFLYHYVPFFNLFRFPALLRIFVIISFIILAGFALNEYLIHTGKYLKQIKIATIITSVLVLLIVAVFSYGQYINLGEYILGGNLFSFSKTSSIAQQVFFQGIVQLIFLGLFILMVYKTKNRQKQLTLLILLVSADMVFSVQLNAPYTVFEKGFYQKDIYEEIERLPKGFPSPDMKPVISTNDRTARHFVTMWRNLNIFYKQIAYDGNNATHLKNYVFLEDSLTPVFKATLQNPPLYLGGSFCPNKDLKEKAKTIVDPSMVFLSEDDLKTLNVGQLQSSDSVWFSNFSPNLIEVETKTKEKGFVVLLLNNYYGWAAEIDGNKTKILSTNLSFIGVEVPAGNHKITYSYKPQFIILGFYISLASVTVSLLTLLFFGTVKLRQS